MKYTIKIIAIAAIFAATTSTAVARDVCNSKGYAGIGGPAYDGIGSPTYDGIEGPCYAGIGGPCYSGIGGSGANCPSICK